MAAARRELSDSAGDLHDFFFRFFCAEFPFSAGFFESDLELREIVRGGADRRTAIGLWLEPFNEFRKRHFASRVVHRLSADSAGGHDSSDGAHLRIWDGYRGAASERQGD